MLKIKLNYQGKSLAVYETENDQIRVGRNSANDIHIDNLAVSGSHAVIKRVMNNYFIEDLNSTNGTFVNEKKITKYEILDGDEVIIGKHSLTFHYFSSFSAQKNAMDQTMVLDTKKQKELLKKNR
jgi:pSer/pThr/pTyr-binding forkhead associated (FHA) protein